MFINLISGEKYYELQVELVSNVTAFCIGGSFELLADGRYFWTYCQVQMGDITWALIWKGNGILIEKYSPGVFHRVLTISEMIQDLLDKSLISDPLVGHCLAAKYSWGK